MSSAPTTSIPLHEAVTFGFCPQVRERLPAGTEHNAITGITVAMRSLVNNERNMAVALIPFIPSEFPTSADRAALHRHLLAVYRHGHHEEQAIRFGYETALYNGSELSLGEFKILFLQSVIVLVWLHINEHFDNFVNGA